ncbi:hypothetical protein AX14_008862, partial [Amanita brunnescens Koide BX004]
KVLKDSHTLRSIIMTVDHKEDVECIVDSGSMIIAMSNAVCNHLGLTYDPMILLNMESANGDIDTSLGLACNLPFTISNITVYLQVHVVQSLAYDILLGQPFEVLTKSIVHNY